MKGHSPTWTVGVCRSSKASRRLAPVKSALRRTAPINTARSRLRPQKGSGFGQHGNLCLTVQLRAINHIEPRQHYARIGERRFQAVGSSDQTPHPRARLTPECGVTTVMPSPASPLGRSQNSRRSGTEPSVNIAMMQSSLRAKSQPLCDNVFDLGCPRCHPAVRWAARTPIARPDRSRR